MNDEERQRTMDFILQQQAHFSAGMQGEKTDRGTVAKRRRTASCGMARSRAAGLRAARRSASLMAEATHVSGT